eukprot:CAMPEP_0171094118 /NCGR_PEP_ID=MMETSP0766_2-20121228/39955_1 /TAXON_ID=439317 /ORGANISM="Gambierdiscus australes, Strain CAWD 149" /LENGTH=267 /DNA_ID=CAMNT_0011552683 /DNA_START=63 /DNA_END=866 /DNA_ORIENTATION=+
MARLTLLFAIACASCHVGTAEDTAALIQRAVSHASEQSLSGLLPEDDVCACKPWKYVYNCKNHSNCTMGHELDVSRDTQEHNEHHPDLIFEWCLMFFGFLPNESFCINTKWEEHPTQWCYVDPACPRSDLPKHHGPFNVKYCEAPIDRVTYGWSLQRVVELSMSAKLNLVFILQYVYPTLDRMIESFMPFSEESLGFCSGRTWFVHAQGGHAKVLDCTGRMPREPLLDREDTGLFTLCDVAENKKDVGYGQKENLYHLEHCRGVVQQ